jgi:CheY-like chemotaxis protein
LLVVIAHAELALDALPREHPARGHLESSKSAAQNAAALAHEFTQGVSACDHAPRNASEHSGTGDHRPTSNLQVEGAQETGDEKLATILFVEDESLVLDSSAEFLQRAGYHILSATTGGDAIELAQSYPDRIDLLITDMVLPQVSGPELARAITAYHPETKVLVVSGHPEEYVLRQPGIVPCLAKPFSFSSLEEKIRSVLYNKKPAHGLGAP